MFADMLRHFEFVIRWGVVSNVTPNGRRKIRRYEAAVQYLRSRRERS